jgi:hypothetical protein
MRLFDSNGLRLAEFQGKLFEKSEQRFACSSPVFLRRFLLSGLLKTLDKNESSFIGWSVDEALEEIESRFGPSHYGKEKYSADALFWMGYLYRYMSYTREMDTPLLFYYFKPKRLNSLFFVYHTQDAEWCIKNLLELQGFSENIFDRNWRLKQEIARRK